MGANEKKRKQLGMSPGMAAGKLRKQILFHLLKQLQQNVCYQCGDTIEYVEDLTIEHKVPWLDSSDPVSLFFSLDNIAFSHLSCNFGAARKPNQKCFTKKDRRLAKAKRERDRRKRQRTERKKHIRREKDKHRGT